MRWVRYDKTDWGVLELLPTCYLLVYCPASSPPVVFPHHPTLKVAERDRILAPALGVCRRRRRGGVADLHLGEMVQGEGWCR
jgi:hypothetical protein